MTKVLVKTAKYHIIRTIPDDKICDKTNNLAHKMKQNTPSREYETIL